ncbi:MAG: phosphoserine phosphatase SerB [Helicobacteraceae bacterium]|jgi:phosphoserine phosphatase|nr:phosphoserine phosphatase SerB [Helicobacteraceae bacterium]
MKLCAFDFDSTLMDGETIDLLAEAYGKAGEVSAITKEAMSGNLDFFEALNRRAALLKGMPYALMKEVCEGLPLMSGAAETVGEMKRRGVIVVIFSGGFKEAVDFASERLGTDAAFANFLHHKDGFLTGLVGGEMMQGDSKGDMLGRLQRLLGVSEEETIAVGDGANDRSMFRYAAVRVAFCAKEALRREANVIVEKKDLREILGHIYQ